MRKVFPKIKSFAAFEKVAENIKLLFVLGPEHFNFFPDLKEKSKIFSKAEQLVWMSQSENNFLSPKKNCFQIPMKSFFEKKGTYVNYQGIEQRIQKGQNLSSQARSIQDCLHFFKGESVDLKKERAYFKQNQFLDKAQQVW